MIVVMMMMMMVRRWLLLLLLFSKLNEINDEFVVARLLKLAAENRDVKVVAKIVGHDDLGKLHLAANVFWSHVHVLVQGVLVGQLAQLGLECQREERVFRGTLSSAF